MASIESVTGPIDAEDLGHTLIHEHRRERDQPNAVRLPHLYDDGAIITLVTDQGRAHAARGRNDEA